MLLLKHWLHSKPRWKDKMSINLGSLWTRRARAWEGKHQQIQTSHKRSPQHQTQSPKLLSQELPKGFHPMKRVIMCWFQAVTTKSWLRLKMTLLLRSTAENIARLKSLQERIALTREEQAEEDQLQEERRIQSIWKSKIIHPPKKSSTRSLRTWANPKRRSSHKPLKLIP